MAQHYPIKNAPLKKLRDVHASIEKEISRARGQVFTSMRYQFIGKQNDCNVFLTDRYIGKGIVCGTERGTIEVHVKDGKAQDIFLVA